MFSILDNSEAGVVEEGDGWGRAVLESSKAGQGRRHLCHKDRASFSGSGTDPMLRKTLCWRTCSAGHCLKLLIFLVKGPLIFISH